MIDLSAISDDALARWARARIQADYELTAHEMDKSAGVPRESVCDIGISFEAGAVMFRDVDTGVVYTLAPPDTLIGQTSDGRHVTYRNGHEILSAPCEHERASRALTI